MKPVFKTELESGCVLITGGARSGKSSLALRLCNDINLEKVFIATAESKDREMEERIKLHREERGEAWITVEEPLDVVDRIDVLNGVNRVILIDCLTLWLSNQFIKHEKDMGEIKRAVEGLAGKLEKATGVIVAVSNDVGMGIVPENWLAREFRDMAGYMNQRIGAVAKKVVITFAGFPMILKDV
jgi:adenosylcobinamide kinase/adenosylcobinamide-phosphate guanylyltransferase